MPEILTAADPETEIDEVVDETETVADVADDEPEVDYDNAGFDDADDADDADTAPPWLRRKNRSPRL